jgi:hypothetical protein
MSADTDLHSRLGRLEADADSSRSQRAAIFQKLETVGPALIESERRIIAAIEAKVSPLADRVRAVENEVSTAKTALRVHRWYIGGAVALASLLGPKIADGVAKKLGLG